MRSRQARAGLLLIVVFSVVVTARLAWIGYGPPVGTDQLDAQAAYLNAAIDHGAAAEMQQLFPEGAFFLTALTASATAATPDADHARLRLLRDTLDRPESVAVFGSGMVPEHGIFQAGWALSIAVDVAEATGDPADRADVDRRATIVDGALRASPTGFLPGYPEQFWPCDSVVAAAGLARAAVLLGRPAWLDTVREWRALALRVADPDLGLLPHRVDGSGRALEGPRGSSQSIIQAFWPAIGQALDGQPDLAAWARFRAAFLTREAGLVGVREYPLGTVGEGDVDSGPLLLGISASASTVMIAAARGHGDDELATSLDREAELLGFPLALAGQRRYALGRLPVADAFLAWARSRPLLDGADVAAGQGSDLQPRWPVMLGLSLAPGVAAAFRLRRRRGAPVV